MHISISQTKLRINYSIMSCSLFQKGFTLIILHWIIIQQNWFHDNILQIKFDVIFSSRSEININNYLNSVFHIIGASYPKLQKTCFMFHSFKKISKEPFYNLFFISLFTCNSRNSILEFSAIRNMFFLSSTMSSRTFYYGLTY